VIWYLIALVTFDEEYVFIQHETDSGFLLFLFEEIKIIAYLGTINIQNTGTP
jgi:hypothetical protein